MIQNISKTLLRHHPDNPRKDLGDIEELKNSIEKNGVLQNLMVIPSEDGECFYVLIGNRRLEAALQIDDVEELPCDIITKEISKEEAVSIMLTENIIRENMTAYEEAEGFQYMLDLGSTVEAVAEKYGYSKSTVSKRTNLLKLDKKKFKSAVERGATLFDMEKIEKIADEDTRKKLLDKVGTKNFDMALKSAEDAEANAQYLDDIRDHVLEIAKEVDKAEWKNGNFCAFIGEEAIPVKQIGSYRIYNKEDFDYAKYPDGKDYYFRCTEYDITVYEPLSEEELKTKETKDEINLAKKEQNERMETLVNNTRKLVNDLHDEFILNYSKSKKMLKEILPYAAYAVIRDNRISETAMKTMFNLSDEEVVKPNSWSIEYKLHKDEPEKNLIVAIYLSLKSRSSIPYQTRYNDGYCLYHFRDEYVNEENEFLKTLGYEMSEDEEAYFNGTHALYTKVEEKKEESA